MDSQQELERLKILLSPTGVCSFERQLAIGVLETSEFNYQVTSSQKAQVQVKSRVISVQVQVESQVFCDFVKSSPKSSNW